MAHRSLVCCLQLRAGGGGVWKPNCDMDHSCAQAHEDSDKLLSAEPGVFGCVNGCFQYFNKLYLCRSRGVVLRGSLLQIPQFLSSHICVCKHLLNGGNSCGQVGFIKCSKKKKKVKQIMFCCSTCTSYTNSFFIGHRVNWLRSYFRFTNSL